MSQNIQIYDCENFPFDDLKLSNPIAQSGGTYLIRFSHNNQPIYIQPPKCFSKQGVIQSNRKFFIDLMFSNENVSFMEFLEKLEENSQQYIFKNKESWFDGNIEYSDIENFFQSPSKMYKSGKYYLVRSTIPSVLGKPQLTIYDEQENSVELTSLTNEDSIMSILEVSGIKCSARTFQIVLEVKQMMKLQKQNIFSKCLFSSKPNMITPIPEIPKEDKIVEESNKNIDSESLDIVLNDEDVQEETVNLVENETNNNLVVEDTEERGENELLLIEDVKNNEQSDETVTEENIPMDVSLPTQDNEEIREQDNQIKIDAEDNNQMFSQNLQELELCVDDLEVQEPYSINERKDVYYKMYKDARKKAKIAKELALASYLEARNIKNTYMLEDIENSDSEDELETFETAN